MNFEDALKGGDLRSIGNSNKIVHLINDQYSFDKLYKLLFHPDRKVVMRSADAIEKITYSKPALLQKHKKEILQICETAKDIELKWHLAQLMPRLVLTKHEVLKVWNILFTWAGNKNESKIVRVHSIQSLDMLLPENNKHKLQYNQLITALCKENIPSINARIKKLRNSNL